MKKRYYIRVNGKEDFENVVKVLNSELGMFEGWEIKFSDDGYRNCVIEVVSEKELLSDKRISEDEFKQMVEERRSKGLIR